MTAITRIISGTAGFLAVLSTQAGCSNPLRIPIGTYRGNLNRASTGEPDKVLTAQLNRVDLVVRRGDTAGLVIGGLPMEGDLIPDGPEVIFRATSIAGMPMERQPAEVKANAEHRLKPMASKNWLLDNTIMLIPQPIPSTQR